MVLMMYIMQAERNLYHFLPNFAVPLSLFERGRVARTRTGIHPTCLPGGWGSLNGGGMRWLPGPQDPPERWFLQEAGQVIKFVELLFTNNLVPLKFLICLIGSRR